MDIVSVGIGQEVAKRLHSGWRNCTPQLLMSLKAACSPALRRRKSGVLLGPSTWQREHSSYELHPARADTGFSCCLRRRPLEGRLNAAARASAPARRPA